MSKTQAIRLKKVHRSIGIVLVFFLLALAVTGILLNHSDDLGLPERPVPSLIAGWYYDDGLVHVDGFKAADQVVYLFGTNVYVNDQVGATCASDLAGAINVGNQIVALCGDELLLMSVQGELIESLGAAHGLPAGIDSLGRQGNDLILATPDGPHVFDLAMLLARPAAPEIDWQVPMAVPEDLTRRLLADVVSWEKFIRDLHSGRILSSAGVWLVDLVAILLVVMSVSGIVLGRIPYRSSGGSESE